MCKVEKLVRLKVGNIQGPLKLISKLKAYCSIQNTDSICDTSTNVLACATGMELTDTERERRWEIGKD